MENIEYNYNTARDILEKITPILNANIINIILLLVLIILFYLFVFYLIPMMIWIQNDIAKKRQKDKQSKILKRIILQKNLEDEILKEL